MNTPQRRMREALLKQGQLVWDRGNIEMDPHRNRYEEIHGGTKD